MKIETYLNAFEKTVHEMAWWGDRETRQYIAFRNRILRMFAEKDEYILFLNNLNRASENQIAGLMNDLSRERSERRE